MRSYLRLRLGHKPHEVFAVVFLNAHHQVIDIAELNAEIARIVARQQELRTSIDEIVADLESTK